jgi:hypothetical protein
MLVEVSTATTGNTSYEMDILEIKNAHGRLSQSSGQVRQDITLSGAVRQGLVFYFGHSL